MTENEIPRIPLIEPDEMTDAARDFFAFVDGPGGRASGSKLNVIRTLAHNPELGQHYFQFGVYVLRFSTLNARLRELVTLRTATLYDSDYEWTKHVGAARQAGISDEEIDAVRAEPQWPHWSALEKALLTATDQMIGQNRIDDGVWQVLAGELDHKQQLDFVFTVSSYAMLAMSLGALNIQLEPE
ncbi:MAG: carboxymuconolactone decarboxylase family protein [Novosphingobium sp.]|nr:carboxymuconolactone decarboxylase family protein [Novosphingobium sp.]